MSESFVLPVDKPVGPTSHDIVRDARSALGVRRIGHTGTLDPFASGLLVLCVGKATRLAELFVDLPKRYRARMRLGVSTDTDDRTGEVVSETDPSQLARSRIEAAVAGQVGIRLQQPPSYSAKRVGGRRAYEAARAGEALEIDPVEVRIDRIDVRSIAGGEVEFDVVCGKGTFIRAIARDVGNVLGVGAHLTELRRTAVGHFEVDAAVAANDLSEASIEAGKVSPADAVRHLPRFIGDADAIGKVRNGIRIPCGVEAAEGDRVAILSETGDLIAVAEYRGGLLQPKKVIG